MVPYRYIEVFFLINMLLFRDCLNAYGVMMTVGGYVQLTYSILTCVFLQSSYDIVFAVLALALGLASTWILGKFFNALEKLAIPEAIQRQWSE